MTNHQATFYLQLEAEYGQRYMNHEYVDIVRAIKAVGFTQKRPVKPRPGAVIVKLTVEVPDGAFLPLRPEAVVKVPESLTEMIPIEVEAVDPNGD